MLYSIVIGNIRGAEVSFIQQTKKLNPSLCNMHYACTAAVPRGHINHV